MHRSDIFTGVQFSVEEQREHRESDQWWRWRAMLSPYLRPACTPIGQDADAKKGGGRHFSLASLLSESNVVSAATHYGRTAFARCLCCSTNGEDFFQGISRILVLHKDGIEQKKTTLRSKYECKSRGFLRVEKILTVLSYSRTLTFHTCRLNRLKSLQLEKGEKRPKKLTSFSSTRDREFLLVKHQ